MQYPTLMLCTLLLMCAPYPAHAKTWRVAVDAEFAPFEFTDETGEARGIAPDVLRAIAQGEGLHLTFVPMSWSEAVEALNSGRVDLVQMIRTKERERHYLFSMPLLRLTQALFVRRNSGIHGMKDLAGHAVAVQRHDIAAEILAGHHDIHRIQVDNKSLGMELLQQGEADAFLTAELPGQYLLRRTFLPAVVMAEGGLRPRLLCLASRRDHRALIARLNAGLARLKKSGRLNDIIQRWTHPRPTGGWPGQLAAWIMPLLATALFAAPWIRRKSASTHPS